MSTIPGLHLVAGYLGAARQQRLLEVIDEQPWSAELRRRVQHYGYRYDYRRRTVDADLYLGPLPSWVEELARGLVADGRIAQHPDQVIINEYLPGQGIAAHVDCVPCFGDTIISVSLGSACVFTMSHPDPGIADVPVLLEPGSLLTMTGEARYAWRHAIAGRKTDLINGQTLHRGRRVSLTFRRVVHPRQPVAG
jgi:alkylated DNA repair dioxygenase AlkB